ncbi:Capsular polysaccharide biosynthesis protein capD [Fictibacillus macauensis ZFHKF-1]|uniref:Capsular polysaccharide biosynthesis protein capD n=1 Tax=Fictibacillus macauensis ZFHKF-1 TaxID=1196324 RepID=I8UAN3_9BACL|nr:nucleoside-diphosphate sugar epimerase/dehydratase [Fictibacillus macauensis]EIT83970.1 Capsular polysaccharide biosynthesis protein capD [Fictibacillus macauensis ZFHKF-1]
MGYQIRVATLMTLDSLFVLLAIYLGYFTLHPYLDLYTLKSVAISSVALLISHHVFALSYRLYKKAWEYASVGEMLAIVRAVTLSLIVTGIVQWSVIGDVYVRVLGITWMLHIILIGGFRFSWRALRDYYVRPDQQKRNTLIVGAGAAGTMLVRQLMKSKDSELFPVGFVDDDPKKARLQILGVTVYGRTQMIPDIVEKLKIENIIIAIPSLNKHDIQKIYQECSKTNANTKIMPMIEDIASGKVSVNQFRDVQVEDLLGREPVELDTEILLEKLSNKIVLVTGAGGSIGSEICRQICKFKPKKILLLGHGENSIYQIDIELRAKYKGEIDIVPIIADVQDKDRLYEVMSLHLPNVIYHAAAHKHVPLMEYNPREAVKNNVIGTKNVAEVADLFGVTTFVLISSDKAVNPTNVMGSTKRIAEMIIQQINKQSDTNFVAVRFGNVLGSRGSVIPLFKKQIQDGGPVTVTHPDMTRYFMTIPEASRLVLQAGALARGGEIFVLDMGEPVKIEELAKNLIQLSGYTLEEVGLKYSGLRPGEKMYEELLNEDEVHSIEIFPKILIGKTVVFDYKKISELIENYANFTQEGIASYVLELANKPEKRSYACRDLEKVIKTI